MAKAETNGRPWYLKIIEMVMSEKGMVAVFAVVLLTFFMYSQWIERKERSASNAQSLVERKAFIKAFEGLTIAFDKMVLTGEATKNVLQELSIKADMMSGAAPQREQHHAEIMVEMSAQTSSLLRLEGEVIGSEGLSELKDGQKRIEDKLP